MSTSPKVAAVLAWLQQGSTIIGIAVLAGTGAGLANGKITWSEAVVPVVTALVAMALPQRTDVQSAAGKAATDLVTVVGSRGLQGTMALGNDLVTVAGLLHPAQPVIAVQQTVAPIAPSAAAPAPVAAAPAPVQTTISAQATAPTTAAPVAAVLLLVGLALGLSACAGGAVSTSTTDANLIVSALQPIVADIAEQSGLPATTIATIEGYAAQAQTDAAALAGSSGSATAFVTEVESLATAALPLTGLPAADVTAIEAADALLPGILAAAGVSAARARATATAVTMDPATARLRLAAFAAR